MIGFRDWLKGERIISAEVYSVAKGLKTIENAMIEAQNRSTRGHALSNMSLGIRTQDGNKSLVLTFKQCSSGSMRIFLKVLKTKLAKMVEKQEAWILNEEDGY